jgi:uncharacterized protein GlcG (DUF336 family)
MLKQRMMLTESAVKAIAEAAVVEAKKNKWAVSIAIVDDAGQLLFFTRLDGAAKISSIIAPGKAKTAALSSKESKFYEDVINGGRYSFLSVGENMAFLEGGLPIIVEGICIGAVGVSGVKSSEDAQIAAAGITALNIK